MVGDSPEISLFLVQVKFTFTGISLFCANLSAQLHVNFPSDSALWRLHALHGGARRTPQEFLEQVQERQMLTLGTRVLHALS